MISSSATPQFSSKEEELWWKELKRLTHEFKSGNFIQDKLLAFKILKNSESEDYSKFSVAVHRYGPVPVLISPIVIKQEINGHEIDCNVAYYYLRPNENRRSKKELIRSNVPLFNTLDNRLSVITRKYIHDITQTFTSIAQESDLKNTLINCGIIEEILGSSISSKISKAFPSKNKEFLNGFENYKNGTLHRTDKFYEEYFFFERNTYSIIWSKYAYLFIYILLNDLYELIGISPKKDFNLRLLELEKEVDQLLGAKSYENLIQNCHELNSLSKMKLKYDTGDTEELEKLDFHEIWLNQLKEFAIFLIQISNFNSNPFTAKYFLSYSHLADSELVRNKICSILEENTELKLEPIVLNLDYQQNLNNEIKTRIWLSDSLIGIICKRTKKVGGGDGNYDWILKESEYAKFLQKDTYFLIEEDISIDHIESKLVGKDLLHHVDSYDSKKAEFLSEIRNKKYYKYSITGESYSTLNITGPVDSFLFETGKKLLSKKQKVLIQGLLGKLKNETKIFLACYYRTFGHNFEQSRDIIESELTNKFHARLYRYFGTKSKVRGLLNRTEKEATKRSLFYQNENHKIFEQTTNNMFKLRIVSLFNDFNPQLSRKELLAFTDEILREEYTKNVESRLV